MAFIRHMRWSVISACRPGGLITEITWNAGRLEVICLHGRHCGAAAPISDEWRNCIWRFGVMGGKEFTLSNPLFTLSALDYFPFFTI